MGEGVRLEVATDLYGRGGAGGVWTSRVNNAAPIGHFVFAGIFDSIVVVKRVNQTKVEDHLVQNRD